MSYNLLKNKKGIIFGALNENSIAWQVAQKIKKEGGRFVLSNSETGIRTGKIKLLSKICNTEIVSANINSINDINNLFTQSTLILNGKIDFILHSVALSKNIRKKNNYGNLNYKWFLETLNVSGLSFHKMIQTAEKLNIINKWGSIVTLSFIGSQKVYPGYSDMSQAKAILESITRNYGYRFAKKNKIRINTILQSPTITTAGKGIKKFNKIYKYTHKISPLGNADIEDCSNFIVFMFSDLSKMITMQSLIHDGGFSNCGITEDIL